MSRRVAIIGAGGISRSHARACRAIEDAELVAVCDAQSEAATELAGEFGAAIATATVPELLEQVGSVDVAIVSTWGSTHAPITAALARSGRVRAILCEKPLAMDAAEAETMAQVCASNGVLLAEAFRLRHQPIHQQAIQLLRSGRIGDVLQIQSRIAEHVPPDQRRRELNWRYRAEDGGGVTFDIGCYCIQHARWAMGAEPQAVQAVGRWGALSGVDEHVAVTLNFPGERSAQFFVSWDANAAQEARVFGTAGALSIENAWGPDDWQARTIEIRNGRGPVERVDFPPISQFGLQLQHLFDCLEYGQPHRLPPSDSVAQMRVIDAVYASLRGGGAPVAVTSSSAREAPVA